MTIDEYKQVRDKVVKLVTSAVDEEKKRLVLERSFLTSVQKRSLNVATAAYKQGALTGALTDVLKNYNV